MKNQIKYESLMLLLIGLLIFLFSLFIAPFHINGDQAYYSAAFEEIRGLNIIDGLVVYRSHIFTNEPVHFIISWIFSNIGISKNSTMAVFNSILVILFAKILLLKKYPSWLIFILLFNSYIMVLLFTLERNKIAFIFIFALILYKSFFIYILSILSHASTIIILLPSIFINYLYKNQLKSSRKYVFPFFLIFTLIVYFFLFEHLTDKFSAYTDPETSDGGPPFLLFVIFLFTLLFAKNRKIVLIYFLPLIVLFFFIGPTRLNMYGFFVYLFLSNPRNIYFQAATGIIGFYLLVKSYIYMYMVINLGG